MRFFKVVIVLFIIIPLFVLGVEKESGSDLCDSLKEKNFEKSLEAIKKSKNVNVKCKSNSKGQYPAHLTFLNFKDKESLILLKLLVQKGADLNIKDNGGCTPIDFINSWVKTKIGVINESFKFLLRESELPKNLVSYCSYVDWPHGDKPNYDFLPQDYLFSAIYSDDIDNLNYLSEKFQLRQIIETRKCGSKLEKNCKLLRYSPLVEAIEWIGLGSGKGSSLKVIEKLIDLGFAQNGYIKIGSLSKEELVDIFTYLDRGKRTKEDKEEIKRLLLLKGFKKLPPVHTFGDEISSENIIINKKPTN